MSGEFDHRIRDALRARAVQAEGIDDVMGDVDRRFRRHTRNRRTAGAALCLAVLALVALAGVPALGPGGGDVEFADPRDGEVEREDDDAQDAEDADTDPDGTEPGEGDDDGEAGGGEDRDDGEGEGEPDAAESEPSEGEDEPPEDEDPEPVWAACEGVMRGVVYELSYPAGWWTPGDGLACGVFHPEPYDVPENANQLPGIAIRMIVLDQPLHEVANPTFADVRFSDEREVAGRPALYQEGEEQDGETAGTRFTRYLVDLGDQTMLLHTSDAADAGSYDDNGQVLGDMADSLEITGQNEDSGLDGETEPVRREPADEGGPSGLLTETRVGRHEGFDRVVFEFDAEQIPGYEIEYVDPPLRYAPSGKRAEVGGEAFLSVTLWPATARNMGQDPVGETRERIDGPPAGEITEVVRLTDHHRVVKWVIGLDGGERPFEAQVLEDPTRIVVDIAR